MCSANNYLSVVLLIMLNNSISLSDMIPYMAYGLSLESLVTTQKCCSCRQSLMVSIISVCFNCLILIDIIEDVKFIYWLWMYIYKKYVNVPLPILFKWGLILLYWTSYVITYFCYFKLVSDVSFCPQGSYFTCFYMYTWVEWECVIKFLCIQMKVDTYIYNEE
jgi:hypothetical protein